MSDTVLQCGNLSVRSRKAAERFKIATSRGLSLDKAQYRLEGMNEVNISIQKTPYKLETAYNESILETSDSCDAIFFDQTDYTFSIKLPESTTEAWLFSPIQSWCNKSDWDSESRKLSIPINFGNDLGDFQVCWEWKTADEEWHQASFSSQVFSTKLDLYTHFDIMLKEVGQKFNWVQLDLLRQTTWGWQSDPETDSNLRTWLLIFQEVRQEMSERYRKLISQHRSRLVEETRMLRAEQMKKISPRLEEAVAEGLRDNPNRRYRVPRRVLDADTLDNRYMKHILIQTIEQLNLIIDEIEGLERFSDIFKARLKEWSSEWSMLKQHRFWRGIGPFRGMRRASLILSQDPIYAGIRRSYFLLQQGLAFFKQDLQGGIQNAAQLYEVWCFVKMDQLLRELKWTQKSEYHDSTSFDDFLDLEKQDLQAGAVRLSYKRPDLDDVELSLLFQPSATSRRNSDLWDGMMAVPVNQQPDLVLRLRRNDLPQKPVYTWIFDAKYRIKDNSAPDDAVNQMHRYRDAIIWAEESTGAGPYVREGIGAYVLYPGDDEKVKENSKQITSIDKTNIGAFPLRPNLSNKVSKHLKTHVENLLKVNSDESVSKIKEDAYYYAVPTTKRPSRQTFIKCVTRNGEEMSTPKYWETCCYYRLPVKRASTIDLDRVRQGFLVPVNNEGDPLGTFPIVDVEKKKRREIQHDYSSKNITMPEKKGAENDDYYLFSLDPGLDYQPELVDIPEGQIFVIDDTIVDDAQTITGL